MSKLPFMPLYVADYDAATNWCDLETDGLYMRVLRLLWSTPTQSIPDDEKWIIRKLRINADQYDTFLIIKEEYLDVDNSRISQKRLTDEFAKAEEMHNMRVSNGSKGGKAKSLNNNKKNSSKAIAPLKPSSSQALASTSTVTDTSNKEKYTKEFELFMSEYPNQEDMHAASKNFTKEKKFTTAKHLTECAKVYAQFVIDNNKQDYAFKAKNWIREKIYENYQPVDQNLKTWEIKLEHYKKGKWPPEWGSQPCINGWLIADHGECPADLAKRFIQINRANSEGDIGRC